MSPSEFLALADETLNAIEDAVATLGDTTDVDIEATRSGNVVTIDIDNGSKIIVNSQEPMQEIWLAAKAGGFHFKWNGNAWIDTRGAGEFFAVLSQHASTQAGVPIVIKG
ncbi:iron donor protein CyaY [Derxia gummosa]|uniref:Iron-sulfur cluster assembly protein CyaY n=1 Tax=Derxia gummosa DSM 723 TaxID=1121388 RepID=A0A8B6X0V9_9BURK|nr:iron donor protein CyaY [Derxia gummosa]